MFNDNPIGESSLTRRAIGGMAKVSRSSTKNPSWGLLDRRVGKLAREVSASTRGGLFVCRALQDDQALFMNAPVQSSGVKTKNITSGLVFGWLFGIIFVIMGLTNLGDNTTSGILFLIAALLILPPINKLLKEKVHISLSRGLRIIIVGILLVVGFSFVGSHAVKEAETNAVANASTPKPGPKPVIRVTADQIMSDYTANEVSADAKYKGNLVEVSGTVESIGKDIVDTAYIALHTGGQYSISVVQCMFPKTAESALAEVSKGERITLQGQVSGKLGNVILRSCKII